MLNKHLKLLTLSERTVALNLLGYPENSIGRLMTPDYSAVKADWTINDVLSYIRKYGENSETLNVIYIIDDKGILIDDIKVREILIADPQTKLQEIIDGRYTALSVLDDEEVAINVFSKTNRVALPVIDKNGLLNNPFKFITGILFSFSISDKLIPVSPPGEFWSQWYKI
jgi:magnesium transporter